ncbi:MAG: hypothetical protein JWM31_3510 [Solirubrobacterales bacterium]|nr:hypothetical protein [Solirubrobacterales bacterium]
MPAVDPKSPLTILGASGVALLVFMLLPWYGLDLGDLAGAASIAGVDTTASAWTAFSYTDLLLFLTGVGAIAAFVLSSQHNPLAAQVIKGVTGLAALMTLIVLYRIVNQPGPNDFITVKFGAFFGLVAVAGVAYGAFRSMTAGNQPYVEPVR